MTDSDLAKCKQLRDEALAGAAYCRNETAPHDAFLRDITAPKYDAEAAFWDRIIARLEASSSLRAGLDAAYKHVLHGCHGTALMALKKLLSVSGEESSAGSSGTPGAGSDISNDRSPRRQWIIIDAIELLPASRALSAADMSEIADAVLPLLRDYPDLPADSQAGGTS